ncbi:hypothetical protein D9M70_253820 [compost metagenome]
MVDVQRGELVRRHRPAEEEALHLVARVFAEEVQLFLALHALGDHHQVQAVGHGDDGAGDLRVLFAVGQAVDEAAVDLQHVDGELLEVVERGIAGAEVIHRHRQAEALQPGEGLHRLGDVAHQDAFGQLQLQAGRRRAGLVEDVGDARAQLAVGELARRQVHRDLRHPHLLPVPDLELAAGLAQQPVADLGDQAELLQHRHELRRGDQPAARVLPAQQRLGAGQAAAVAGELRLVVQGELVLLDGAAQVAFQLQALQRAGVHFRLVELVVVLAHFLGVVHRRVGVLHQLVQLGAVLRRQRHADAGGDEELAAFQGERPGQAGEDLLGDLDRPHQRLFAVALARQQQGELVAAHARHGVVVAHATGQALGHFLEHAVAGGVAEGVVDRLEAVEVEEHQHHPFLVPLGVLQGGVQAVLEQRAVGQVGEGVVVGQAVDAPFAGLALADVAEEADEADQVAVLVVHRGDPDPGRIEPAAAALEEDFPLPVAVVLQAVQHVHELVAALVLGGEHARLLVQHLARRIAGQAREGAVDLDDVAGRVGDHDRRGGMLEHRRRHAHLALRAALLGNVAGHAEQALEASLFVPHQGDAQLDRHLAAVGAQAVEVEQVRRAGLAQFHRQLRIADGLAGAGEQGVEPVELRRVGDDLLEAVLQRPFRAVAEVLLQRRADVVEVQLGVGGEDHVADAFRQHAVAAVALVQRVVGFHRGGDVLDHAQQLAHAPRGIAAEGLFADVQPAPAAVVMAPAQLAFEQQVVADHLLQVADAPVVFLVVGVHQGVPVALADALQVGAAVAELGAQAVVAEQQLAARQVLDVEGVRHRADHVRPELLALQQGQFHLLALGDVRQADGHRAQFFQLLGNAHLQPDMALLALRGADDGFQLDHPVAAEHRRDDLAARAFGTHARGADHLFPGLLDRVHAEQAAGDAVDLADADLAQHPGLALGLLRQPGAQVLGVVQALFEQAVAQLGEVDHAQRHAGILEHGLLAAADGLGRRLHRRGQLHHQGGVLPAVQAPQGRAGDTADQQQERQFAGEPGQHGLVQRVAVEQRAQLPVGVGDRQQAQALRLLARRGGAQRGARQAAGAAEHLVLVVVFEQPGDIRAHVLGPGAARGVAVEADDPLAAAVARAQEQVEQPAVVLAEGVVVGLAGGALAQRGDELLVHDRGAGVEQALAAGVQPDLAVQVGEEAAQGLALVGRAGGQGAVLFDQRLRGEGLELERQGQVLRQLLDVQHGALALVALVVAEFVQEMPAGQAEKQQNEQQDGASRGQFACCGQVGRWRINGFGQEPATWGEMREFLPD